MIQMKQNIPRYKRKIFEPSRSTFGDLILPFVRKKYQYTF